MVHATAASFLIIRPEPAGDAVSACWDAAGVTACCISCHTPGDEAEAERTAIPMGFPNQKK